MRRMKLTNAGRAVIFILVAAILACCGYFAWKTFGSNVSGEDVQNNLDNIIHSDKNENPSTSDKDAASKDEQDNAADNNVINLSLDEWIGYESAVYANGGHTTQPGSIFDKLGIKVNLHIINDAEASSNALIKGDLDAAGYTLNRTAFLSGKFADAGLDIIMPVFTNFSNGGDGIIALREFNSVESLVDAKIGVPRYSEAQSLVIWLVNKSDLSDDAKQKIINNLILMDDAEQTGQAFFAGSLDVAATWQPYLSNAENSTNSHILFDTTSSNKLILSGIVFRKDFAEANPDLVTKFIEGILIAREEYEQDFDTIRSVMPMFAGMTDEEIKEMRKDAGMMGYNENIDTLENDCPVVYADMCAIWESIGETVDESVVDTLFDTSYIEPLEAKYATLQQDNSFEITEEQKEAVVDLAAMMTKTCTLNFLPDTAKFIDNAEAAEILNEFVEIAKTLDGTIIQIEGNINATKTSEAGVKLSEERAKTVMNYFVANGIDPNRIIFIGNGNTKMVVEPGSEDAYKNRRTDVFFKTIEGGF